MRTASKRGSCFKGLALVIVAVAMAFSSAVPASARAFAYGQAQPEPVTEQLSSNKVLDQENTAKVVSAFAESTWSDLVDEIFPASVFVACHFAISSICPNAPPFAASF